MHMMNKTNSMILDKSIQSSYRSHKYSFIEEPCEQEDFTF